LQKIKLVVTGPTACGKSTFIQKVGGKRALSINYKGRTVAMDFVHCNLYGLDVFAFGTPGHENFEFMRKILVRGAHGLLVLFDSTRPQTLHIALQMLDRLLKELDKKIPVILVANKQDLPNALDVSYFSRLIGNVFPVVGISAKTGNGVRKVVQRLLHMALMNLRNCILKTPVYSSTGYLK